MTQLIMEESIAEKKEKLELEQQALEVEELQIRLKNLRRPQYLRVSFWTSIIPVSIAVLGIAGQSYLSYEETLKAEEKIEIAEGEIETAGLVKDSARVQLKIAEDSQHNAEEKRDSLASQIVDMVEPLANKTGQLTKTETAVLEASINVSGILAEEASEKLLKNSYFKVYYSMTTQEQGRKIMKLLRKGKVSVMGYLTQTSDRKLNEIVYSNKIHISNCKALQTLLKNNGCGKFTIRRSNEVDQLPEYINVYIAV